MVFHKNQKAAQQQSVKFKKSMLAMCVIALSAPTFAQDAATANKSVENVEEIVVSGVRANLQSAQDIKRESPTFVDSISSEDIGSLPDRSVLEAIQRVPGVSIERFAAANDPDHFGVEGSGAVIRGMSATRSEFNGRDSFTANSGRGLSFQDVPPELMGGVDVYKNQTADMIEGGIGGTVSLRTRKPFDSSERVIAVSADYSYGDIAEEWTPTISALYSDRWDTDAGEFGFLLNVADSSLKGISHGIQSDAYVQYDAKVLAGAEDFVGDGTGEVWMPNGANLTQKFDDRDRQGFATAIQWESPDDTLLGTFQFMRSDATLAWNENALKYQGGYAENERHTRPLLGTEFDFDSDGVFEAGTLTNSNGWRSSENAGRIPNQYGGQDKVAGQWGNIFQADTRVKETNTVVDDYAFNLKWTPSDQFELVADFQHIEAETHDDDLTVMLATFAMQEYDTRGDTPTLRLIEPWNGVRDNNPSGYSDPANQQSIGFLGDPAGDKNWFQDPTSYMWQSAMDHYEHSEGDSDAVRLDSTYNFDDAGLLTAVKVGLRFADREQTVRSTSYNWGALGPRWVSPILWVDSAAVAGQETELVDWSDFHGGGVLTIPGGSLLHPTVDLVKEVMDGRVLAETGNGWVPASDRPDATIEGRYSPADIYITEEKNEAAYVRLDFGSDESAYRFNGNVGLRYMKLTRTAAGSVKYPDLVPKNPVPADAPGVAATPEAKIAWAEDAVEAGRYATMDDALAWAYDSNNLISDHDRAFGNDAFTVQDAESEYDTFLPSFNLKVELTDDLIARFAVAKAIAMPDMGDVKNNSDLGATVVVEDPPVDPNNPDAITFPESATVDRWTGSAGNPYMQPMESTQWDMSLEWYFAQVGSLTTTIFHKDLSNFFIKGAFERDYTNPTTDTTQAVTTDTTINNGTGTIQGIEFAYQQFYDMLPAPWDGLGLQVNYSYIDSTSVPNAGFSDGTTNDTGAPLDLADGLPLQGQSKDTFNIVGMYDKGDWSLRMAYNWRSKYLLTTRDVISKYPLWNEDAGFLDASAFYTVNDNLKLGIQFTNLMDTQTETVMILDKEGTTAGRSWFVNDRRVALIARATF
ncbi:MAG TPA: TonB-dependent receptor [Cellvibrio sp.]|nr:TonB-dependent receptor [Cellvibrio sp.]